MGTIGPSEQVERRRKRGLRMLKQGQSTSAVARRLGVSARTVRRWRQEQQAGQKRAVKRRGRACRLTPRQLTKLEAALDQGAYAHGYAEDYWTLDRIAHVVWNLFGVRYHPSSVWQSVTLRPPPPPVAPSCPHR